VRKIEEKALKEHLKERIGEGIDKMETQECFQLLLCLNGYGIVPIRSSFAKEIEEVPFEKIKTIGEAAMRTENTFESFLSLLSPKQVIRFIEEEEEKIVFLDLTGVALREYLRNIFRRQTRLGKITFLIDFRKESSSLKREVESLRIERKEIPVYFSTIPTWPLLSRKEKRSFSERGASILVIKFIEFRRGQPRGSWKEFMHGVELCFIPEKKSLFKGRIIQRPHPAFLNGGTFDEVVETVTKLLIRGGISIKWSVVSNEVVRILQGFKSSPVSVVNFDQLQRINEITKSGYYYKKS